MNTSSVLTLVKMKQQAEKAKGEIKTKNICHPLRLLISRGSVGWSLHKIRLGKNSRLAAMSVSRPFGTVWKG